MGPNKKNNKVNNKRKAPAVSVEQNVEEEDESNESEYESDTENLLTSIKNDEGDDSTDSEGENGDEEVYTSDDEEALLFESDHENEELENGNDEEDSRDEEEEDENESEESDEIEEEDEDESESDVPADDIVKDVKMKVAQSDNKKKEDKPTNGQDAFREHMKQSLGLDVETNGTTNGTSTILQGLDIVEEFKKELKKDLGLPKGYDEYADGDTSDEEDIRNTVGNIPMHWYDEYNHIGYDWDGKKIMKPPQRDRLDEFLRQMEDPNFWRTVKDPQTGQDVILSNDDIALIKRIMAQRNPDQNFTEYAPWIEWFTNEVEQLPIRNIPDHKRSFLPSKGEKLQVGRLVHALKMGWAKTRAEEARIRKERKQPKFYMLWETDHGREKMRRIHDHVAAPKRALPGHAESYNPPPEYLFNNKEIQEWQDLKEEPHKRKLHFLPRKYKSLREVPYYDRYIRERFLRCLDLYLCPRAKRMRVTVQPEDLIPKLPSPKDLQPFPTMQNLIYRGHTGIIRAISIEPRGEYLVSGSDDMTVKIWEISTARCIKTIKTKNIVRSVAWCPNSKLSLIAVASGQQVLLINPGVGDKLLVRKTDDILAEAPKTELLENERITAAVQWDVPDTEEQEQGIRIIVNHFKEVKQVSWHGRGDYFAVVMPDGSNRSVLIHQLSKRRSQIPFSKSKGLIQCVLFHPIKPCLFVATQRHVRIYDLVKQELIKKLIANCKWISGIAIHPKGDNLLVSSYDKKMMWFDLDLSTKPYQTLKLHSSAIRSIAFHLRYPLFASVSDDRDVIVSHGMVYNDLLQNPLIVPLKRLQYHERRDDFGVFDVLFHPTQPWIFSSGADQTIRLYS